MAYLNIVFHNIQHGGAVINGVNSRQHYAVNLPGQLNVYQTAAGPGSTAGAVGGPAGAVAGVWGNCATATMAAPVNTSGIFFCESHDYGHADYNNWQGAPPAVPATGINAVPAFPVNYINSGFTPYATLNTLCAYLIGNPDNNAVGVRAAPAPVVASPHWMTAANRALCCLGTGAAPLLNGNAPWGSDRYGILFQAQYRTFPNGDGITGIFVHIKNTDADPGTQIAALCRNYPGSIIFGDLNLNLRQGFTRASLQEAIGNTHTLLAITDVVGGNYYYTRYDAFGAGTACLDYALIPNVHVADVELWSRRAGAAATLSTNNSDHSVMMLRIRCN